MYVRNLVNTVSKLQMAADEVNRAFEPVDRALSSFVDILEVGQVDAFTLYTKGLSVEAPSFFQQCQTNHTPGEEGRPATGP